MRASNLKIDEKYNIELQDGSKIIVTYCGCGNTDVDADFHKFRLADGTEFSCLADSAGYINQITKIEQKWTICFNSKEDAEFYARQIQPWAAAMITVKQI